MKNIKIKITQLLKMMKVCIKKTEEEEALIECLMSMNSPLKFINDAIGTITSCEKKMIEFEK